MLGCAHMKRRLLPLALVMAPALLGYACSSSDDKKTEETPTPVEEASPGTDTSVPDPMDSSVADTSKPDTSEAGPSGNPIEGVVNATPIVALEGIYTEGPQWVGDGLYYSEAKPDGHLIKFTPPSTTNIVRNVLTATNIPLGTTLDEKTNTLVTLEVNQATKGATLVRTPVTGAFPRTGTAIVLTFDGGASIFDSPNDVVARKIDGTLYMTDPSYQAQQGGGVTTNHIWRVKPTTNVVTEIQIAGRPNGIALSPDDSSLYVSFTDPEALAAPFISKYPVNVDGSLGVAVKFVDIPPGGDQDVNSLADGLAVDTSGNVYVAVRNGVEVFKPDGTKWGKINSAKIVNGLAFGGTDRKTLFMTSETGLLTATVKIAGLVQ
jgi:gluconolactonase